MEKLNKEQIINLLPHREPMLLIDELYDKTKGTINDLENFHIKEQKKRIENISNTYSINYTGENQG